jgi:hypothetical protein
MVGLEVMQFVRACHVHAEGVLPHLKYVQVKSLLPNCDHFTGCELVCGTHALRCGWTTACRQSKGAPALEHKKWQGC